MRNYQYFIAGMGILCRVPFPVVIQKEAEEFLVPVEADGTDVPEEVPGVMYDAVVTFAQAAVLPEVPADAVCRADRFYSRDKNGRDQVHYCVCPGAKPYACTVWDEDGLGRPDVLCSYLPGNEFRFSHSRMISDHIGMETMLLRKKGLMLHASFIRWKEKGILFTAPSGTGKSTQAELWNKYEGAEILNGDRAAVRSTEGRWYAYGLPYAGSSGIYRNEKARLSAVVVLRQAESNKIRRMELLEIIQNLYPEITIHHWEREFIEKALTVLTSLAEDVPFYLLESLPDFEAVEIVKKQISGMEG